ncbi:MAG: DegQ family serine endoprotease [Deferrisomatales bacterium]
MPRRSLGLALVALLAVAPSPTRSAVRPDTFADLAESLRPSVVNLSSTKTVSRKLPRGAPSPFGQRDRFRDFFGEEFFERFFGEPPGPPRDFRSKSLGSGVLIDAEGFIVTNNHVVEGADEVLIRLSDEHEFTARVVGTDPKTDLALIKIDSGGAPLRPAVLGDSDAVRVGDWVVAIGNPFGYSHTVTAGIISAKGRVIGAGPYDSFLQTDAAINPGNSGGPLFDLSGRVVGINTAIVAGGTGIGFAIPINMVKAIVDQLKAGGKVTRGWLGVMIQEVTKDLAPSFGLESPRGALISDVVKGSPADTAGLARGDVILEFDGRAVDKVGELPRLVAERVPGARVRVVVLRKGAQETVEVTLGELKDDPLAGQARIEEELGLTVQAVTPELRKHLGLDADTGVVVSGVEPGSPAATAGVRRGDLLLEVNQREVADLDAYQQALGEARGKGSVLLLVRRGQGTLYVVVPLTK